MIKLSLNIFICISFRKLLTFWRIVWLRIKLLLLFSFLPHPLLFFQLISHSNPLEHLIATLFNLDSSYIQVAFRLWWPLLSISIQWVRSCLNEFWYFHYFTSNRWMLVQLKAKLFKINCQLKFLCHHVLGLLLILLEHRHEAIVLQFFYAIHQLHLIDVGVRKFPAILLNLVEHLIDSQDFLFPS